jgi:aspartyl/asparaginyl-tRNA synthetase
LNMLAIFKIQAKLVQGMQEYLRDNGFLQVFTPCFMGAPSESGSEVFAVPYFNKEVFLRQDPQLHRQLIITSGFDRIYDIGPSWRAENSNTARHMCEHRGCAPEMTLTDERDTMKVEEEMVAHAFRLVKRDCREDLKILGVDLKVPKTPFPVLEFPKIYDILKKMGSKTRHGEDLAREDEKLLQDYVDKKYKSDFFFVNRFPFAHKPFYVMRFDDEPEYARSVDLIYRGIEQSSGGQREHRYDKIMEQVKIKKMSPESVEWFTKFFRYGAPPHGGFCIGIERLTMQMLGIQNVREATLFPRDPDRILP